MNREKSNGLLAGYDLGELRAKMKRPPFRQALGGMMDKVHAVAGTDCADGPLTSHGWCHSLFFTPSVLEAGLVHAMTGDAAAAAHVGRQIDKLARVYADPPESFRRSFGDKGLPPVPSAYFSNALTGLAARLCADALPPATYATLLGLMRDRLIDDNRDPEYNFTHFHAGNNVIVTHVISAAVCALVFGRECGHPDTDRLIECGRDACVGHLRWGFDSQGVPYEGPMYAYVTLEWVFLYADLLRRHGGEDLFHTRPEFGAILDAGINMQLPGFCGISGFDDCRDLITNHPMPWLPLTAHILDRPRDLALWHRLRNLAAPDEWQWSRGWSDVLELLWYDGNPPLHSIESYDLPIAYVGHGKAVAVLRGSWHKDATCVTLLGQGRSHSAGLHQHADAGHFSIFTHGEMPAYDTAYFNVQDDLHSTILIDGRPFSNASQSDMHAGRFMATKHLALLDHVAVDMSGARGCLWAQRHFLFIRGAGDTCYLVILDNINKDNAVHRFTWQLQANLDTSVRVTGERQAMVQGRAARLDCHFFNPLPDDFPSCPHQMSVSTDHHEHRNVLSGDPEANPRLLVEQTGCNCTMMSVVVPRGINQPELIVRDATAYRTFNVLIEHDDVVDQVIYACDHGFVRLPGVRADSEMIVLRRDRGGRLLDAWSNDGQPVDA